MAARSEQNALRRGGAQQGPQGSDVQVGSRHPGDAIQHGGHGALLPLEADQGEVLCRPCVPGVQVSVPLHRPAEFIVSS